MIASRHSGVERVSTLQGQKVAMSIDLSAEAVASMMRSMIDLYNDQVMACVREYSTNARDAHVQAGCPDRAIEVTLPGPLHPFFTVQDFGIGLSVDDIIEVYSKYGASTKRESNDVQGMLGYGCKAALSYTPQFTVTSVKDGVRAQIAVSREGDGGGSMQVVDTSATTEGNGTIITIPVRSEHIDDFAERARFLFSVWREDWPVLVNGKTPDRVKGLPIGKDMIVYDAGNNRYGGREDAKSYVVMGGVPYPARFPGVDLARGFGLIAWVGIGEVNFTPSREGLMDQDPDTTATLADVGTAFNSLAPQAIQTELDASPTPSAALDTYVRFSAMLPRARTGSYTYKGATLPTQHRFTAGTTLATRRSTALTTCQSLWEYEATMWPRTLWMENHDGTKYTATHKRKTLQWCDANAHADKTHFVHLDGKVPSELRRFIPKQNIIQWADVKAEKLPTTGGVAGAYSNRPTKAITGSFVAGVDGDWKGEIAAKDFDTTKPMYYRHGNSNQCYRFWRAIDAMDPQHTFVCVPGNRLAKFKRDFPQAQEAGDALTRSFKAWKDALTDDVKLAMAMEAAGATAFFSALDILRVNDPELKQAIRIAKIDLTKVAEQRKLYERVVYGRLELPRYENPILSYPLIHRQYGGYFTPNDAALDHFYIYVNAAYAASKNGA